MISVVFCGVVASGSAGVFRAIRGGVSDGGDDGA